MQGTFRRVVFGFLGMAAILLGVLSLMGRQPLGDITPTLVALGAILNGALVTQMAFTPKRAV